MKRRNKKKIELDDRDKHTIFNIQNSNIRISYSAFYSLLNTKKNSQHFSNYYLGEKRWPIFNEQNFYFLKQTLLLLYITLNPHCYVTSYYHENVDTDVDVGVVPIYITDTVKMKSITIVAFGFFFAIRNDPEPMPNTQTLSFALLKCPFILFTIRSSHYGNNYHLYIVK